MKFASGYFLSRFPLKEHHCSLLSYLTQEEEHFGLSNKCRKVCEYADKNCENGWKTGHSTASKLSNTSQCPEKCPPLRNSAAELQPQINSANRRNEENADTATTGLCSNV